MNNIKTSAVFLFLSFAILTCKSKQGTKEESKSPFDSFVPNDTSALYEWSELGCCEFKGIYNPKKISFEQLDNTRKLLVGSSFGYDDEIHEPEDIEKISLSTLSSKYSKLIKDVRDGNIVQLKYWEELRKLRIREIEESYELQKIKIEAFSDSSVLLDNRFTQHCNEYVTSLTSGDSTLLSDWKKLAEILKEKTGSPEGYMTGFYKKYNSDKKLLYAKIDLITYWWNNCANDEVYHLNTNEEMGKEFEKLFRLLEPDCGGCD